MAIFNGCQFFSTNNCRKRNNSNEIKKSKKYIPYLFLSSYRYNPLISFYISPEFKLIVFHFMLFYSRMLYFWLLDTRIWTDSVRFIWLVRLKCFQGTVLEQI